MRWWWWEWWEWIVLRLMAQIMADSGGVAAGVLVCVEVRCRLPGLHP